MKKTILIIFLLLIPVAYSAIITQEQLDGIDAETYNLQCQYEEDGINSNNYYHQPSNMKFVVRTYSCLDLEPIENTTTYNVFRKNIYLYQSHKEFKMCYLTGKILEPYMNQTNIWNFCQDQLIQNLKDQYTSAKITIRNKIIDYQTDQDINFTGNFTIQ